MFENVNNLVHGTNIIKMRAGKYMIPVIGTLDTKKNTFELAFGYNPALLEEVKMLEKREWNAKPGAANPRKTWTVPMTHRNMFALEYLMGGNPYSDFKKEVPEYKSPFNRPLAPHQCELVSFGLENRFALWAADMGLGKTLAAIELADYVNANIFPLNSDNAWYVGCKSALVSAKIEIGVWNAQVPFTFMTYEALVSLIKSWPSGRKSPQFLILDESSHLKTPTSQRSQQTMHLCTAMRKEWGRDCFIIEMTGTPAPRAPENWWHQCELLCPGYLREPSMDLFKARFCLIEKRETLDGAGTYPHLVTYLDDENKCKVCGQYADHQNHVSVEKALAEGIDFKRVHTFVPSVNEVNKLYHRLKGLVVVKKKADCQDLPEKLYRMQQIRPTPEMLRAYQLIKTTAPRAITALTLCREISDGFQYVDEEVEQITCPNCNGKGECAQEAIVDNEYAQKDGTCHVCSGTGYVPRYERTTKHVGTPKDEALLDLLEEYDETGRFVVWAGYTASIDHIVPLVKSKGWAVLRVDGRGYHGENYDGKPLDTDILLDCMRNNSKNKEVLRVEYPRVCFVGNPQAGGMGLTLHASPIAVYYSNTFDGGARMQSEDRIHRMGMDSNKAALIVDFILLPTDKLVYDNLKKKKRLQDLTMAELNAIS